MATFLRFGNVRLQSPRNATQIAQNDVSVQKTFIKKVILAFIYKLMKKRRQNGWDGEVYVKDQEEKVDTLLTCKQMIRFTWYIPWPRPDRGGGHITPF